MSRFILTDTAKADLLQIVEYLQERSPQATLAVAREIRLALRQVAEFPGIGHARCDLTRRSVRFWSVYSYLIVYKPNTQPLQILRVLHGARNIRRILSR